MLGIDSMGLLVLLADTERDNDWQQIVLVEVSRQGSRTEQPKIYSQIAVSIRGCTWGAMYGTSLLTTPKKITLSLGAELEANMFEHKSGRNSNPG